MINRLRRPFSRRWWWTTLIVVAGVVVLVRLGFWQLDRLEQRRAFNMKVVERWNQPPYDLNENQLPTDLAELEYRQVEIEGIWDYENQLVLTSQTRDNVPGVILVTPLVLDDDRAVLVARGWIPQSKPDPATWDEFHELDNSPIVGLIQESQLLPNGDAPAIPDTPQREWYRINIAAMQPQMPYTLLPVFILQLPEPDRPYSALPFRTEPIQLDEGNHFSYAIQWYMFALILGVGYFFFVEHQELRERRLTQTDNDDEMIAPEIGRSAHRGHA